tara:strand:- start:296 stop:646 length:351 start_codon:yes stop_codon:yes gene_type:complete
MEDYEINILRRGGNWKKVKPNDLIIDEINNELIENNESTHQKSENDLLSYITKVDSIISRLETLESEKNKLKDELKVFENKFLSKKKLAEDAINKISEEKDMIEKTINVIKNLKSF